ncbi:hypothetical protein Bbelb_024820 [Branchiostoma belcheri]|nr:hypothetical protein Bbelb_024820 [Branchiostoma belcheri]
MHTDTCPAGLKTMLPKPYTFRRTTRTSLAMPTHALAQPVSRTSSTGRTFIHSGVQIWNQLPDSIVGNINNNGLQSFKGDRPREYVTRTVAQGVRTWSARHAWPSAVACIVHCSSAYDLCAIATLPRSGRTYTCGVRTVSLLTRTL